MALNDQYILGDLKLLSTLNNIEKSVFPALKNNGDMTSQKYKGPMHCYLHI